MSTNPYYIAQCCISYFRLFHINFMFTFCKGAQANIDFTNLHIT